MNIRKTLLLVYIFICKVTSDKLDKVYLRLLSLKIRSKIDEIR